MKETGMIFTTESVRAILNGRKTQTRRVIKLKGYHRNVWDYCVPHNGAVAELLGEPYLKVPYDAITDNAGNRITCPYGQVGDRLWLKHRYDLFDVYYKPIEGFEGFYSAGTDGHIYRVDKGEPTVLQEAPSGDKGYLAVTLSKPEYRHTHFVHRLIAKTFYGLPPVELYQYQTRHLDGKNQNNHPSNLDWGTQEDNWADRKFHGRKMGEEHHSSKLTTAQVITIRQSPLSQRQLAHTYGVSQPTIQAVLSGKFWQDAKSQLPRNYPQWQGWKSPLFMPRWASRITLEITEVRVERVQEISTEDIEQEGVTAELDFGYGLIEEELARESYLRGQFSQVWDFLNAKRGYSWEVNPWVWVISFATGVRLK